MRRSVWERCMAHGRVFTRQYQYLLNPLCFTAEGRLRFSLPLCIVRRPLGADLWDTADDTVVWVQNPLDPDSHIGL